MKMKFPEPDIEEFKKVLKRREKGKRVHIAEFHIDKEILSHIKKFIKIEKTIGIFQGDDMGFKTQTLLPPHFFKKYILPWHKKISELCHENNKIYVLHSCGNIQPLMDFLIEEVRIDAKHSFGCENMVVWDFKKKYGDKIGIIGGVDVGKLCLL